jgi:competence protein ComEC
MKRPLVLFCLSLIAGIVCTNITHSYLFAVLSCLVIALILFVLLNNKKGSIFVLSGMVLFYLTGALYYLYTYNQNLYKFEAYAGKSVLIKGYIDSAPDIKESGITYILKVEEIEARGETDGTKKIQGKIKLSMQQGDTPALLEYGREIMVSGKLNLPKGKTNPRGFDYRSYLCHSGVSATLFAAERNIQPQDNVKGNLMVKAGLFIRDRIVRVINRSLPPQQAGLLNGMLIGYREGLTEEVEDMFSRSGLTHIMAVSGANIAFIMLPLVFIFKKLRFKKTFSNILIIGILIMFTFVTGFEPSVLRAVIMAVVVLVGQIIMRETEIYTSIAFAAVALLLYNPGSLFSIGFQLSFAATISLVLFYKNIKNMIDFSFIPEFIVDVLASTLAAQVGVLPVTVFYFNKISIVSILSNLIVLPVLEFITILGALMAVFGQVHIGLSILLGYCNNALLSFVLFATKVTAEVPYSVVTVSTPSIIFIILYYIAVIYFLWYKPKHKVKLHFKYYALTGALIVALIMINLFLPKGMEVVFLDVGQGDCAFIKTQGGKTVLIDGGPDYAGENTVVPFLLDYGISKLDLVVLTHGHDDHAKGVIPVFEYFAVDNVVMPDTVLEERLIDVYEIAQKMNIPLEGCEKGDVIKLDQKTYIEVLHPKEGSYIEESSQNNNSLVLMLCYGDVKILFTGDIEKEAEELLLKDMTELDADVLKVAHHGSSTSSTEEFIVGVEPAVAVISVGSNNFGHPSDEVLTLFESKNIEVVRTDQHGAIVLKTRGEDIKLNTEIKKR